MKEKKYNLISDFKMMQGIPLFKAIDASNADKITFAY